MIVRYFQLSIIMFSTGGVALKATPPVFFEGNPTSYLYAHGLFAGEAQMAKYCPSFIASTGELVSCDMGGEVIGSMCNAVTFAEIDNSKFVFSAHPLKWPNMLVRGCSSPCMQYAALGQYGITVQGTDLADKTAGRIWFALNRLNLGQDDDIALLNEAYRLHREQYPEANIVLYGVSRGSAAIVNFLAHYHPSDVQAAILEGVFDDIPHLLKHFGFSGKGRLIEEIAHAALSFIAGSYCTAGPFPFESVDSLSRDIPLLLVTSLKDWQVPYQCTIRLYRKLREAGHDKVHLLVLRNAGHSDYMIGDTEDRRVYETIVNAFYRHYGLAYNKMLAEIGQAFFMETTPSLKQIQEEYLIKNSCCEKCCHETVEK